MPAAILPHDGKFKTADFSVLVHRVISESAEQNIPVSVVVFDHDSRTLSFAETWATQMPPAPTNFPPGWCAGRKERALKAYAALKEEMEALASSQPGWRYFWKYVSGIPVIVTLDPLHALNLFRQNAMYARRFFITPHGQTAHMATIILTLQAASKEAKATHPTL